MLVHHVCPIVRRIRPLDCDSEAVQSARNLVPNYLLVKVPRASGFANSLRQDMWEWNYRAVGNLISDHDAAKTALNCDPVDLRERFLHLCEIRFQCLFQVPPVPRILLDVLLVVDRVVVWRRSYRDPDYAISQGYPQCARTDQTGLRAPAYQGRSKATRASYIRIEWGYFASWANVNIFVEKQHLNWLFSRTCVYLIGSR